MRSEPIRSACFTARVRRTWLFDLDNTLHNASAHIFPQIHRQMVDYICAVLDVDEDEATRLRQNYWQRYGATLFGMMRHHNTDPRHFLHHTHQLPNLKSLIVVERALKSALRRLPGKKIVFSNAPLVYAEAVLSTSRIRRCFDAVYSLERLDFQPKPAIAGFLRIIKGEGLDPRSCAMVDDTLCNLETAKQLGMKTVWVSACTRQSPYVDVKVATVLDLPKRLGRL